MSVYSMLGAFTVTLALLSYGIGSISLQRFKMISKGVLWFLTVGVLLDMTATTFMIIGSRNTPFTFHGFLGYSALTVMIIELILVWRLYLKKGLDCVIGKGMNLYTKAAYGWWVIAYITGSMLVIWK